MKRFLRDHIHPAPVSGAEILFVIAVLVLGGSAVFIIPPSAGYDEDQHLIRVWQLSALRIIPNQDLGPDFPYPATLHHMLRTEESTAAAWAKYAGLPLDGMDYIYSGLGTRSIYSPLLLMPQAIVMRYLGRAHDAPVLVVFYGCRLASLLSYLVLGWLAIRLIPYGKWILAVTALAPMALFEAATVSADPIANGIGLVFIAGCLWLNARPKLEWRHWLGLGLLVALLFAAKTNMYAIIVLVPILFMPSRFRQRGAYVFLIIGCIALGLLEGGGWLLLTSSRFGGDMGCGPNTGIQLQLQNLRSNPLPLMHALLVDPWIHGIPYITSWIAAYAYPVSAAVYWLFLLALGIVMVTDIRGTLPNWRARIGLLIAFVVAFLSVQILLYMGCSPAGSPTIEGVQGRYFVAAFPLLCLGLAGLAGFKLKAKLPPWTAAIPLVLSIAIYLFGILR